MFKVKDMMFIIAETPLHPGSGSELGIVDLPIQREIHTGFPKIEASSVKGCLREAFREAFREGVEDKEIISLVFGPEKEEGELHAGAISITDAKILLFPVKSLKGVFAWITCPMVLKRLQKDLEIIGEKDFNFEIVKGSVPLDSEVVIFNKREEKVVLEEFTFKVKQKEETSKIAGWLSENVFPSEEPYNFWKEKLKKSLVILSDDEFAQFVKTSTEVITRTKIDPDKGTVQRGALWTEEYLPQDTVLYSVLMFTCPRVKDEKKKKKFSADTPEEEARLVYKFFRKEVPEVIQIGGNQTIGKGFVRIKFLKEGANNG